MHPSYPHLLWTTFSLARRPVSCRSLFLTSWLAFLITSAGRTLAGEATRNSIRMKRNIRMRFHVTVCRAWACRGVNRYGSPSQGKEEGQNVRRWRRGGAGFPTGFVSVCSVTSVVVSGVYSIAVHTTGRAAKIDLTSPRTSIDLNMLNFSRLFKIMVRRRRTPHRALRAAR